MRFDIVSDPAKIARIQKRLADRDQQQLASRGALVRYELPALPSAFPQLSRILLGSTHRARFFGVHYHIKSRDGRVERLLPAAEEDGAGPVSCPRPSTTNSSSALWPISAMPWSSGSAVCTSSNAGSSAITTSFETPCCGPTSHPPGSWTRSTR